jgi:two-component system, OmpR family, heavy metal sensor histidine kinase CusS
MKLLRSSRARVALFTALVCALVLGAFAMAAWWKLRDARLLSLDREMESTGVFLSLAARRNLDAATVERGLSQRFGSQRAAGRAFAITIPGSAPRLSSNWPQGFDPEKLTRSTETEERELPGPPDDQGGPRARALPPDDFDGPAPPRREMENRPPPRDSPGPPRGERPGRPLLYRAAFSTVEAGGKTWRAGVFGHATSGIVIRILLDVDVFAADLRGTARAFLLVAPGALLLIAAGAWLAAWRSLAPVQQLAGKISSLSLAKPNERLTAAGADSEFHGLIAAWNDMLERLERSYRQATRFSADASHELKTPLAVMRATVERGLTQCADGSHEQRTYAGLLDELDQLQVIIESLLLLSRADAGLLATSRETLDFSTWLQPLLEDAGLMAEERGITVDAVITEGIRVQADPVLLTRAVHNLLRNAVAYNHDSGEILADLSREGEFAVLRISNTGQPIADEERAQIFDRFKRGANAGGTGQGLGLGIGLSLAKEIALAHGGSLTLDDAPGLTQFALRLPCAL